ncbi:RNA polymerase sigma factor [Saccharibacillus alkalitolerans]|uniref:RNA polymerase sigma factor n=1 Tax=Saccharibacillus alkalitolerans TaxID=2705290 RepID=A0ABX0F1N2_9BACL|nr:RNA polymerase sigma factor [Saccharibacillus alkalitolerans]NGZ74888.1 RNA polymerase sigma factor [Saccharibacillus alkalitolerans]
MDDLELFETYKTTVYRYCLYMLKDRRDAEDVCQEVFVKAMLADRTDLRSEKAWLLRIAANECHGLMRRRIRGRDKEQKAYLRTAPLNHSPSVEAGYELREARAEFGLKLRQVKPKFREVLLLYYMADLPMAEVADMLNLPLGTVKSRINRGLKALKKQMEDENTAVQTKKRSDIHVSNY